MNKGITAVCLAFTTLISANAMAAKNNITCEDENVKIVLQNVGSKGTKVKYTNKLMNERGVQISTHDSTRYSSQDEFRGLKHYRYLLQDRVFIYIEQQDIENNANELVGRLVVAELGARKKEILSLNCRNR